MNKRYKRVCVCVCVCEREREREGERGRERDGHCPIKVEDVNRMLK